MSQCQSQVTPGLFRRPQRDDRFLGLLFDDTTVDEAASLIVSTSQSSEWCYVVTPNAAHLGRLDRQSSLYENAWLRLLDSRVIALTARLVGLTPPQVVTGADLVARLFVDIHQASPVCIVGCTPSVIEQLQSRYALTGILHVNPSHGFWRCDEAMDETARFVVAAQAPLTFLAVGSPQQEMLAERILKLGGAKGVGICCGAAVEFAAGVRARAPIILQRLCLEWAFRLCLEPRRLARRYFIESPQGIAVVLSEAFGQ